MLFSKKYYGFFKNKDLYKYNFVKEVFYSSINETKKHQICMVNKEFLYTKLKYSRVPSVDSGPVMAAAVFSALLINSIAEKFGFETQDSTEFFFILFPLFFLITWVRGLMDKQQNAIFPFIRYFKILFKVIIFEIKELLKKIVPEFDFVI